MAKGLGVTQVLGAQLRVHGLPDGNESWLLSCDLCPSVPTGLGALRCHPGVLQCPPRRFVSFLALSAWREPKGSVLLIARVRPAKLSDNDSQTQ